MAKDDYFYIVYVLLSYLYKCLKKGTAVTPEKLDELGSKYSSEYWTYVLTNLSDDGYITGITKITTLMGESYKATNVKITPKGIEYLNENSTMKKIGKTIRTLPEFAPIVSMFL